MPTLIRTVAAAILCIAPPLAGAHEGFLHGPGESSAPSAGPSSGYAFALPEPGSYRLPPIKRAAGGTVLDEDGQTQRLADLIRGQITVLAFMYTRCGDVCPTATLQISLLQDLAAQDPRLADRLHLVSMSFDPEHDTPSVMAEHAAHWRSDHVGAPDWHFITAPDRATLAPILDAYEQTVGAKSDPQSAGGPLHHIFRAFLIDASGQIRNIYSLDFLDPALVLTDVRTLLLEASSNAPNAHGTR